MEYKYVKGIKVNDMQKAPAIKPHVKDPIRYPKVQCGYENLAQAIFVTQTNNMFKDIVKEMVDIIKE
jgi:hypothetical protein